MARHGILHRRPPVQKDSTQEARAGEDPRTVEDPPTERVVRDRAEEWPGAIQPVPDTVYVGRGWVRVSVWATVGLIVSLVGLCATLTGPLAPEGFALGAVGFLISVGGLVAAGRPGVSGRGLAVLGLVCGLAAVGLAVAAMSGRFSWPNSRTDEIAHWRAWLVAHWSWLGRW